MRLDAVSASRDLYPGHRVPRPRMQADTFAKLVAIDALVEAEIGYLLEVTPTSLKQFREGMVARISDLVDEIDGLDSVAAGRVYDSIVDFLAELPEEADGIV